MEKNNKKNVGQYMFCMGRVVSKTKDEAEIPLET